MAAELTTTSLPPYLLPDREIHVIISVLSGRHLAPGYYHETLKPLLDSHDIKYTTHITESAKTIINLTQKLFVVNATQGVKQTIILLSGDGGIVDIVNTMTGVLNRRNDDVRPPSIFLKPVVVLIPMGTANALAWSSKVAHDPLGVLMRGSPKSLPSFQTRLSPGASLVINEGRGREPLTDSSDEESTMYGAVVFSWGLHASLVAMSDTTEYRKHGLDRFKMAAQQLLTDAHQYRGNVKWRKGGGDWTSIPGTEHSYVLATLVSNLEEHFQISPAQQPLDGTLRLVAIGPEPAQDIMRILGLAYQSGQHVTDPKVTYEEIDSLRIEFEEEEEAWRMLCIDGKIVTIARGGWVEVTRIPGVGIDGRRVIELVC
ncbi:uncharacterized protein Z518_08781 [Rhinocladiella mackenziei CBS 650.93]|uniref:DAGKc domain-containing protein n=1 Tax=Rhinocladiella mackenziei CBS 650.93 TaxID=1442369 RepID=A0A0D2GXC3_9EURO|nr:uncharacterized protein Z518_08781 [Rhinocladiella mackenziei CBS 650.93]KIX02838.1 hypothetical protein Z518_08781 [Rhinocladiella mackenziei CBS 650.93]